MRPAYSVILFTVATGAGYGILFLFALTALQRHMPRDFWYGASVLGLAMGLIGAGAVASGFHLGRPERAWRAFSQWRSSWLSREAVLALAGVLAAAAMAYGWLFTAFEGLAWSISALAVLLVSPATVFATAMIYASLKPVRQWRSPWVPILYLVLALASGALALQATTVLFGYRAPILTGMVVALLLAGALGKLLYWRAIDGQPYAASAGTATGLGRFGVVRMLDSPHTEENYLLHEMGFQVARRHARKLRRLALLFGFALPALLSLPALLGPGLLVGTLAALAFLLAMFGLLIERWLFFAEARHTVMLYYQPGGNA